MFPTPQLKWKLHPEDAEGGNVYVTKKTSLGGSTVQFHWVSVYQVTEENQDWNDMECQL